MKKADFCKKCAIHIGRSQMNKFACTICKRLKGKYYPSKFIKARKPESQKGERTMPNQLAKSMHEIAKKTRLAQRGPTNADRIRSMSDEEMAGFIDDIQNDAFAADGCGYSLHFPDDKETTWIDWLRQPAEE